LAYVINKGIYKPTTMGHILYNYTDICGYLKEQLAGLGVLPRITDTGAKVCIYI